MSPRHTSASFRCIAVAVLFLATAAPTAHAQRLSDMPSGTQLRFRANGDSTTWHRGTFIGVTSDGLAFQEATQLLVVPRDRIGTLEWRDRDASRRLHAVIGGLLVGPALGLSYANEARKCTGYFCPYVPAAAVGAAGFLLGAGIGALLPVQRWHKVDQPLP
jgi:hypothetical protein